MRSGITGTSLGVQWLRLHTSNAEGTSSIPGQRTKILHAEHSSARNNKTVKNQGKLEVVKQEMERVNINILGISELKWIGMGEFNSDDHYIYWARIS